MDIILNGLATPLGILMRVSYQITNNYGIAILIFTVLTRIVLLPISIWLHRYSIRLVKMTPALLHTQITYFGDNDKIAEEQSGLYKKFNYNPLVTLVPLAIQIILLMGVIQVINHPFDYLLQAESATVAAISAFTSDKLGIALADSSLQLSAVGLIKSGVYAQELVALTGNFSTEALQATLTGAQTFNTTLLGIDLLLIPSMVGGWTILAPLAAGLAAVVLCIVQNKANALQAEQGVGNKIFTMLISVGLSMYLGYFVPMGVALYWVAGNLVAVVQQYFLNAIIPPRKHIDYDELKKKQAELKVLQDTKKQNKRSKELVQRERADIKRFNSVANKHLVFYSESSGFYKYYRGIIEYLLDHTNIIIHYITSDPGDNVFKIAEENKQVRAYFVAEYKLISLMMKMDADMVVMTMPDLENYHIKRSYIRKDIEYVYIPHGMDSLNLTMRKASMDHFDTVFCVGPHQKEEIEKTEEIYGLPKKELVEWGYCLLDEMCAAYAASEHQKHERPRILIAPSWQADNIVDSCLSDILGELSHGQYDVTVRPHPQEVRQKPDKMQALKERYADNPYITIQTDFSSNDTVFEADLLISDWSGIAYEYAYTTLKPVLFINTPMKVMNPEYEKIGVEPINIMLREQIGCTLDVQEIGQVSDAVNNLLEQREDYAKKIEAFVDTYVYNLGTSAQAGAKAIIRNLQNKSKVAKK